MDLDIKLLLNHEIMQDIKRSSFEDGYLLATRNDHGKKIIYYPELALEADNENKIAIYSLIKNFNKDIEEYKKALALDRLHVIPYHKSKKKNISNKDILSAIRKNKQNTDDKVDKFLTLSNNKLCLYEYAYFGKPLLIKMDEKSGLDMNNCFLHGGAYPSKTMRDFREFHTYVNHPQLCEKTLDKRKDELKNKSKSKIPLEETFFLLKK